ncbi:MAG TPA: hypothetical protein VGG56_00695 [Terracidiphilus sp.]|jgi:hypothetical protein
MQLKFRFLVLAAMAATALATIPAVAETSTTINVPFNFMVEGQNLPAGTYLVQQVGAGNFLRLRGKDASQSFMWVASPSVHDGRGVTLKFDNQGRTRVLQSIQLGPFETPRLDHKSRKMENISPAYIPGQ